MLREPDPHFRLLDRALAGRYVLERRLGRGGMGVVFLARELRLERRVAIKLLLPAKAVDPVACERFLVDAATGRALVSDFGIARVGAGGGMTGPREVVGTAEFMSPEQASGLGVDARSDLYSLGVVGYYALSGQLPFAAGDSYEMMARH